MLVVAVAVGALMVLAVLPSTSPVSRLEALSALGTAVTTCSTGQNPVVPGYDPVTHEIYVPNAGLSGTPSISVFNETCNLVGTISLSSGAEPWQAAFDPNTNYMYVTDYGLDEVYRISGTTISATLLGFDGPVGITYDPHQGTMLVVDSGNDQVEYIAGTTHHPLFSTGTDPYEIVYDPAWGLDLVTNTGSANVTVYNETSGNTWSTPVGVSPEGIAVDAIGNEYVANTGSDNVTVLVGGYLSDTISGFDHPDAVAWDQSTRTIDVTNVGNGKVYEVTNYYYLGKKLATKSDSAASGLVYDDYNDAMYVTGYGTDVVYVL